MKPRLYLETTVPSYLTSWPSRDLIIAAHQQITQDWWELRRGAFQIYISQFVLDEARAGRRPGCRPTIESVAVPPATGHHARGRGVNLRHSGVRQDPTQSRHRRGAHCNRGRTRHGFPANLELRAHCQCRDTQGDRLNLPGARHANARSSARPRSCKENRPCPGTPSSTKSGAPARKMPPSTVLTSKRSSRPRKSVNADPDTGLYPLSEIAGRRRLSPAVPAPSPTHFDSDSLHRAARVLSAFICVHRRPIWFFPSRRIPFSASQIIWPPTNVDQRRFLLPSGRDDLVI